MAKCDEATTALVRPRLEARRRAFLKAATEVFLRKGYANATLDDVIALSGGSRQTLYSLFGGKQGLFAASVVERSSELVALFHTEALLDRRPDEVLLELGVRYLRVVTTPEALGIYRLVLAEGASMKELAEQFWERSPGQMGSLLADYFRKQNSRGMLLVEDPDNAGQQFWGMLLGNVHLKCVLGLREAPKPDECAALVRIAVARFLDGCRAKIS